MRTFADAPTPTTTIVVAKLATPLVVCGVDEIIGGLEECYGAGLTILTSEHPLWEPDWLIIARQEETDVHDIPPML